jgi:hypothetical protein
MASKEGSSYDWILGEDADEDLEPWQRVLKENAKNAKVERFLELLRGILGPDELLNLAGMVRDMDVRHVQKLYMKQWQEHAMASAHGGADPAAMMMGHPPPTGFTGGGHPPPGFVPPGYPPHMMGGFPPPRPPPRQ